MIYEQIPDIMMGVVRSLYRESYVDLARISPARVGDFVNSSAAIADAKLVLSQVALVVSALCVACIVFIMIQKNALKSASKGKSESAPLVAPPVQPAGVLRERWATLQAHLASSHEAQWKVAVMEADKLVDDALAKAGFPGATFGDRLSNMKPGTLRSLDGVWWAHKIRNRLAHEMDYFLRYTEARQAMGYYEAALSELQLI